MVPTAMRDYPCLYRLAECDLSIQASFLCSLSSIFGLTDEQIVEYSVAYAHISNGVLFAGTGLTDEQVAAAKSKLRAPFKNCKTLTTKYSQYDLKQEACRNCLLSTLFSDEYITEERVLLACILKNDASYSHLRTLLSPSMFRAVCALSPGKCLRSYPLINFNGYLFEFLQELEAMIIPERAAIEPEFCKFLLQKVRKASAERTSCDVGEAREVTLSDIEACVRTEFTVLYGISRFDGDYVLKCLSYVRNSADRQYIPPKICSAVADDNAGSVPGAIHELDKNTRRRGRPKKAASSSASVADAGPDILDYIILHNQMDAVPAVTLPVDTNINTDTEPVALSEPQELMSEFMDDLVTEMTSTVSDNPSVEPYLDNIEPAKNIPASQVIVNHDVVLCSNECNGISDDTDIKNTANACAGMPDSSILNTVNVDIAVNCENIIENISVNNDVVSNVANTDIKSPQDTFIDECSENSESAAPPLLEEAVMPKEDVAERIPIVFSSSCMECARECALPVSDKSGEVMASLCDFKCGLSFPYYDFEPSESVKFIDCSCNDITHIHSFLTDACSSTTVCIEAVMYMGRKGLLIYMPVSSIFYFFDVYFDEMTQFLRPILAPACKVIYLSIDPAPVVSMLYQLGFEHVTVTSLTTLYSCTHVMDENVKLRDMFSIYLLKPAADEFYSGFMPLYQPLYNKLHGTIKSSLQAIQDTVSLFNDLNGFANALGKSYDLTDIVYRLERGARGRDYLDFEFGYEPSDSFIQSGTMYIIHIHGLASIKEDERIRFLCRVAGRVQMHPFKCVLSSYLLTMIDDGLVYYCLGDGDEFFDIFLDCCRKMYQSEYMEIPVLDAKKIIYSNK